MSAAMFIAIALLDANAGPVETLVEEPEAPPPLEAHLPTYILFGDAHDQGLFQFSIRYNLLRNQGKLQGYFAYTQRSWWNLYDSSSPFVENNYRPELLFRWRNNPKRAFCQGFDEIQFGYAHESNGQGSDLSRSWERIFVEPQFVHYFGTPSDETSSIRASLRLWVIFLSDPFNEDIDEYAGPGELVFKASSGATRFGRLEAEILLRKGGYNLRFEHGALQAGLRWDPPWLRHLSMMPGLYAQAFFGALQSLDRYNARDDAVRFGIYLDG